MDKPTTTTINAAAEFRPNAGECSSRKASESLSYTSSNREELVDGRKEKVAELSSQPNYRATIEDLMKFGSVYGTLPQYFEQFSAGFLPRREQDREENTAAAAAAARESLMHLWQQPPEGFRMQRPFYFNPAIFPPMPLQDIPIQYYPYMFPPDIPPFPLGNPHLRPEPPPPDGKTERTPADADQKGNRPVDSSATKKTDGSVKSWKPEQAEAKRKESVIKNIGSTREVSNTENGKITNDMTRKSRLEQQTNGLQKKINYEKQDVVVHSNNVVKTSLARTDKRRTSPITTTRTLEVTGYPSSLVSSPNPRSKPMTLDSASSQYPQGSPYYTYSQSPSRKTYDSVVSQSAARPDDKELERIREEGLRRERWNMKIEARINAGQREEEARSNLRINGVNDGLARRKEIEERDREYLMESRKYRKFLERNSGRHRDEKDERRLRYEEELMSRHLKREQYALMEKERLESDLGRSVSPGYPGNYREMHESWKNSHVLSKASPAPSSSGDERSEPKIIIDKTSSAGGLGKTVPVDRRGDARVERDWNRRAPIDLPENVGTKKSERCPPQGIKSRENHSRDASVSSENSSSSEKEQYEEMKVSDQERLKYRHFGEVPRDGAPYYNPLMLDPRNFDPRLFSSKFNNRFALESPNIDPRNFDPRSFDPRMFDPRTFDPRKFDPRSMEANIENRRERILNEQMDEKQIINERKEERESVKEDRPESNGRLRPEHVRVLRNGDERPRSAPGASNRSESPRFNEREKMRILGEREVKCTNGVTERNIVDAPTAGKNLLREPITQPDRSKHRSPPVNQRIKDDKPMTGDAVVPKSLEPTRTSDVRAATSNGVTKSSGSSIPGTSNLVMTPAGAGYQSMPVVHGEPHPFFRQFLQNDGRMLLMPPTGLPYVMPHAGNAEMQDYLRMLCAMTNEQDPGYMYPNGLAAISQKQAAAVAALATKEPVRNSQQLAKDEEHVQRQRQIAKQQAQEKQEKLQLQQQQQHEQQSQQQQKQRQQQQEQQQHRRQQLEQDKERQQQQLEQNEAQEKERQEQQRQHYLREIHQQQLQQKLEQHQRLQQEQRQKQQQQQQQQLPPEPTSQQIELQQQQQQQQPPPKQQQHEPQKHQQESQQLQQKEQQIQQQQQQQSLLQQRKVVELRRSPPATKLVSYDSSTTRAEEITKQTLQNLASTSLDQRRQPVQVREQSLKEDDFQYPNRPTIEDLPLKNDRIPVVGTEVSPTITDRYPKLERLDVESALGVPCDGELSPTSVSAAEVLSHFRTFTNSSLRYNEDEMKNDQEMESPSNYEDSSSTPTNEERFSFFANTEGEGRDQSVGVSQEPSNEHMATNGEAGPTNNGRIHGDLSELVRAAMINQEQLGIVSETTEIEGDVPELFVECNGEGDMSEDYLSYVSSCSGGEDRDEGPSLFMRSPSIPSSRRLPRYLEDKENVFAKSKRSETKRQNICENINRLRKDAKRGLSQATKDRYATLANNTVTLDADSVLNSACSNIKAATEIGEGQVELREQLLTIQKTFRERQKELTRLKQKERGQDTECGKTSPVKRGPGRPRKRKNFGHQKANVTNTEQSPSRENSPYSEHSPRTESAVIADHEVDELDETEEFKSEAPSPVESVGNEVDGNETELNEIELNEIERDEVEGNGMESVTPELEQSTKFLPTTPPYVPSPQLSIVKPDEHEEQGTQDTEASMITVDQPCNDVEDLNGQNEIIPKKKSKKKRRRITSDSDPEQATATSEGKPKKSKKNKKKNRLKKFELDLGKLGQEKDDEVFASEEQGLELLAKFSSEVSAAIRSLSPTEKISPKKRKHGFAHEDGSAPKQKTPKKMSPKVETSSPPKESTNSISTSLLACQLTPPNDETSPTIHEEKQTAVTPEAVNEKEPDEYTTTTTTSEQKPAEKQKPKTIPLSLSVNDEFYRRRSERIFLSSSSSLNSPTAPGTFDLPSGGKKKGKSAGKSKKKEGESESSTKHSEDVVGEQKSSEHKETSKKKRKVKTKHEEKKKKKTKPKRKGSLGSIGDNTDDEYDDESFVEEIKQLPKRNRQAPRRYIEYDSAEEKEDMKGKEAEVACEPEDDNTELCQEQETTTTTVMEEGEQQQNVEDATTVTVEQLEEIEEALGSGNEDNSKGKDTRQEPEKMYVEKSEETEKVKEEEEEEEEMSKEEEKEKSEDELKMDKGKAHFRWMFTMNELCKDQKLLLPVDGVFYPARIDAIHVPDLYAIILDGERGRNPHFRSSEQLLTEAVKDMQPRSLDEIPLGTRVCAYWSQQYRCFYPGLVSEVPKDEKLGRNSCWVEFDDGDSGEFPLPDVRRIPPDFSNEECDSNSGLPEPKSKKLDLGDGRKGSRGELGDDDTDSGDSMVENGQLNNKNRKTSRDKKRERWKDGKLDKKELCTYSKTIGRRTQGDYYRSRSTKQRALSADSESSRNARADRSHAKRKLTLDLDKSNHCSQQGIPRDEEGDMGWNSDVFSDESPVGKKRFPKYRSANTSDNEDYEALSSDHIWQWSGKPCPNKRKGKGRKVFYKSIFRGEEKISVGDCAVFLSSPSKNPDLPYIGKIIKMWERFNGSKVVRVKWYYHPEETKTGRRPCDGKNGLYLSSHVDENDVQTIAHKCEVVHMNDKSKSKADSDSNNNMFWCIGTYDPLTRTFPSDTE